MIKTTGSYAILLLLLLLNACSSQQGRYQQNNDSTPTRLPNAAELRDATPRKERPSRGGNRDYQVRGKHYQVLTSADNFSQSGIASWYGKKFHGHLTSNGEIYDMYAMSAAHKNLPLPTYAKVTNVKNNKSVIVRVNDRGPFHQDRIIDLSYSAAYKLDMLKTGTAEVKITAIRDFTPVTRQAYRIPVPEAGHYQVILNSDAASYGGSDSCQMGSFESENVAWADQAHSIVLDLPPLAGVLLMRQ